MNWIGLTGGIASGKSTVAKILRDLGLPVVDADSLARSVVAPGAKGLLTIAQTFGPEFLRPDGSLDRAKMGQLIFSETPRRLELEGLLHPLIQELKNAERLRLEHAGCELAFYDIPLLFEKDLARDFDKTILVYCSEAEQLHRLVERDGLSEDEARRRIASQLPIDSKVKLADYVIFNNGGQSELKANTMSVLNELMK
jgi:dephospho-CoA kinase